jgi:hypothetical protein
MKYIKTLSITTIAGLFLSACTPSNSYMHQGINFGANRNADFKHGVQDACLTADGDYKKDSYMFTNNESYRVGWEDGRLKCKGK